MKKKIVTLLLVAAMTGTMVVGCGSKAMLVQKAQDYVIEHANIAYK